MVYNEEKTLIVALRLNPKWQAKFNSYFLNVEKNPK